MMQSGECEREIVLDAGFREEISLKKTPLTLKIQELPPRSVLKIDRNNPKPKLTYWRFAMSQYLENHERSYRRSGRTGWWKTILGNCFTPKQG
jgi:hypothetical protein